MIKKAVITAAGLGTRVMPFSYSTPKEMLPVVVDGAVKPFLQFIFEKLYENDVREFCFVIGKHRQNILDHFSPDYDLLNKLKKGEKEKIAKMLEIFYEKIEKSKIVWIQNPNSKGFGHSVLKSEYFVGNDNFVVCASDTWVTSEDFLKRAYSKFLKGNVDATLILKGVQNPEIYGVAVVDNHGSVKETVEKPKIPPSNLGIVPIYIFSKRIFEKLREVEKSYSGEFHLTYAIECLVKEGKVNAILLRDGEEWLDIGTPETYHKVINILR